MEERFTNNILLTVHIGAFIEMVKSLRLSVKYEHDDGGIYASVSEFRGSAYASSVEECNKELVHDMKDWADAFASDFENWRLGREDEIPYLLKVLLSSEEELLSCLSLVMHGDTCACMESIMRQMDITQDDFNRGL